MSGEINLKTISESGKPPETRLGDALETLSVVEQLVEANEKRSATDAEVKGMMDGNPPFVQAELDAAAQSWRCNRNWRIGEAFLNIGLSVYWDIHNEASPHAQCMTEWSESNDQNQEWSGVITEEFERLNKRDTSLNNMFRDSQHDMVLYRMGPVMWEDAFDYRAKPVRCANLLTLDGAPSDINGHKIDVVRSTYTADDLYSFIRNPKAAERAGWDVGFARKVLKNALPVTDYPNKRRSWEAYQQMMRNNDIYVSMQSEAIPVAHVFCREFVKEGDSEGRISHFMVVEGSPSAEYLFQRIGRYANWRQVLCPFYYDTGDGSHHSVKGLGIKAYGFLETINRLMCHEVDMSFIGSGMNFQFKSSADKELMQLLQIGPVNFWPEGVNLLPQVNTGQLLVAPTATRRSLLGTVSSNLSQYREGIDQERTGNPATAREIDWRSNNQNFIKQSSVSYYFDQLDDFYAERFRRAANPNLTETNPGGRDALEFQGRCRKRGVPKEALAKIDSVTATRTIGAGSADARLQTLMRLLARLPLYNETGRQRILEDLTAADVGHSLMRRYIPEVKSSAAIQFQESQAQDKVALLRLNIIPKVTSDQNPMVYASTFLQAAAESLAGLQQGQGNPMEVTVFVDNCGRAAAIHIERLKGDKTREQEYEGLLEQLTELGRQNDELKKLIEQQMQQGPQQMQKQQQAMTDAERKDYIAQRDMARKDAKAENDKRAKMAKTRFGMQLDTLTTKQQLAINDVMTATKIETDKLKAKNNGSSDR